MAGGVPQTASGVVRVVTAEGIEGLRRTLGCTRRQAEQCFLLAQRAWPRAGCWTLTTSPRARFRRPRPA